MPLQTSMECHTTAIFNQHIIFRMSNTSCNVIAHVRDFYATTECDRSGTSLRVRAISQYDAVSRIQSDQIAASFSLLSSNQLSLSLCCLPSRSAPPQVSCDRSCFLDHCFQQECLASDSVKPNRKMERAGRLCPMVLLQYFCQLFAHSFSCLCIFSSV